MSPAIGILGGTFDPVHNAHLAIARLALQHAAGKVLWIPTGAPGYRQPPLAAAADRLAMLRLALAGEARWEIDERELRPGSSGYTFDTVSALKSENPRGEFVLLMGADQFEKRASWHRWDEIEKLCAIAVVARPGAKLDANVQVLPMNQMAVSASDIRARLGRGEDVAGMVPADVLAYIHKKGLYS